MRRFFPGCTPHRQQPATSAALVIDEDEPAVGDGRRVAARAVAVLALSLGSQGGLPARVAREVQVHHGVLPVDGRGEDDVITPHDRRRATPAWQFHLPRQAVLGRPFHRIRAGVGAPHGIRPSPNRPANRRQLGGVTNGGKQKDPGDGLKVSRHVSFPR